MNEFEEGFLDTMLEEAAGRVSPPDVWTRMRAGRPAPARNLIFGGMLMAAAALMTVSVIYSLVVTAPPPPQTPTPDAQDSELFQERKLLTIPEGRFFDYVAVSPTGKMTAYIAATDDGEAWTVYVGEQSIGSYTKVPRYFEFNATETAVAFIGDAGMAVIADDKGEWTSEPPRGSIDPPIVFSPAGDVVAYSTGRTVYVGGRKGPLFEKTGRPFFSADGKHVGYVAQFNGDTFAVVDNQRRPVDEPWLDGKIPLNPTLAFYTGEEAKVHIVVTLPPELGSGDHYHLLGDGERYDADPAIELVEGNVDQVLDLSSMSMVEISANNHPLLYRDDMRLESVVIDRASNKIIERWSKGGSHGIAFTRTPIEWFGGRPTALFVSPDGTRLVCIAPDGNRFVVASGAWKSEPYDQVWTPIFSADGKKLAFAARKGPEIWWKVVTLEE